MWIKDTPAGKQFFPTTQALSFLGEVHYRQIKCTFYSPISKLSIYLYTFQRVFHKDVVWLRDTGILEKLKYDIIRPPLHIPYPKVRRDQPLIISQLGIVMIVLVVGLFLSLPVFFCELMKGRGKKLNDQQLKDSTMPAEGENIQVAKVEHLTLLYYGRSLEEYL